MNKNEPVLCPWCNQPMKPVAMAHDKSGHEKRFTGECWCTSCQAVSPIAEGKDGNGYATRERAKEAAVKIALKRYEAGKGGRRMKITLELPDSTQAAFINYICHEHGEMLLVSKGVDTKDIGNGYKDCREYEVNK